MKGDTTMTTNCEHKNVRMIGEVAHCADCEPVEYISVTDTAKLIRAALKAAFPDTKFSVRSKSYSGGASIDISYTDGPPNFAVEDVVKRFEGASFDGMQDLKEYHDSVFNGRPVHFGANFVFVHRKYSGETIINEFGRSVTNPDGPVQTVRRLLSERMHESTSWQWMERAEWVILARMDMRFETFERTINRFFAEGCKSYVR